MSTARDLIADAFTILNVYAAGQAVDARDEQTAYRFLQRMLGQWALQPGTVPALTRETWPLASGRGGPTTMYTYGPGGDFNTTRAPNQMAFTGAMLKLGSTAFPNEVLVPLAIITDDQWQALAIPDLPNSQPTCVYYNPTFTSNLGQIGLWPVPNTNANSLILFRKTQLAQFATVTEDRVFPEGYEEAIVYNLAYRLCVPYGRQMPPEAKDIQEMSLTLVKRSNFKLSDLKQGAEFVKNWASGYNINSGQGGGN